MGLLALAAVVVAIATAANNQEESPVLWGALAFVFAIAGGLFVPYIGQIVGGILAFGLMQLKIAKFG